MYRPVLFLLLFTTLMCFGQNDCNLTLEGRIIDSKSSAGLEYGNIYIVETGTGTISDSNGYFIIPKLCSGNYHVSFSHIGCEKEQHYISLNNDTTINIYLHHHAELLDELTIHGHKDELSIQSNNTINNDKILSESHKNLGDILSSIQGVSTLKTGGNVSKPIVHGLYGNRISISNNGVIQAGQQWGNDHAPEIDAFAADHISVVKGASALAYGGNSLGSIILIESKSIEEDPHIHGLVNYRMQSNGVGHTLNAKIEKFDNWAAWRIGGTLKLSGDQRSAKYFLTNTGKREYSIAAQLEKSINEKWKIETYYSAFFTEIGILRGSHIGNVTDLKNALVQEKPFFTSDKFSYGIEAPRQKVMHHLLKIATRYQLSDHHLLSFKYGGQLNQRKEFDIRRQDRSSKPALSILQHTHFLEAIYSGSFKKNATLKSGLQFNFVDNTNNPETGTLPLIPDYRAYTTSSFFIFKNHFDKLSFEFGGRYNLKLLEAVTIQRGASFSIERFNHTFHSYTFSTGVNAKLHPNYKMNFEAGYALRTPEINELYSSGLHQGVSGIEEGNQTLQAERSAKLILSNNFDIKDRLFIQALAYYQNIQNYMYLQLENELRLTIQGAFPVFSYTQTNANLFGTDLLASAVLRDNIKLILKYALVRGNDVVNNTAIINLPSDNLEASINYSFKDGTKLKNTTLSLTGNYNFKQKKVVSEVIRDNESETTISIPEGYLLLQFNASTELSLKKSSLKFRLGFDNLLNKKYRNYLNRQRYFADDAGIDVNLSLLYEF